jgi:hypothetical protein
MRRSVVLFVVGVVALATSTASCASGSSTDQSGPAAQTSTVAPTTAVTPTTQSADGSTPSVQAAPVPDTSKCNELNIPAFRPDNSDRGPLPGGGATALALWAKVTALRTGDYDPAPDFNLGLAVAFLAEQPGVICPNGDVFLQGGGSSPILQNVRLLNSQPNGGAPAIPGGRLWTHSAADAIGGVPCLAIIQMNKPADMTLRETIKAGMVGATCTANGSFHEIPVAPQPLYTGKD